MTGFEGTQLVLSQSFRFGPHLAQEANRWLAIAEAPIRLSGTPAVLTELGHLVRPDAVLSSPGIARNNRKAPRCERHDAFLHPEEQAEVAARFPSGHQAQMAFLLAAFARNASVVAALLGTRARTVHRHCRGWSLPPGPRLRRALRRRVLDLVCPRCLSDRAVGEARQAKRDARRAARRIPRD